MGDIIRAAAVQLNSTEDIEANLAAADRLVREAAERGAQLVVLPEKWNAPETLEAPPQTLTGPAASWAAGAAKDLGIDLIAGSIIETGPFNTSVHYGPDGAAKATYRKLHIFEAEVDGITYAEREQAGQQVVSSQLKDGTGIGLSICYDLRFPELYRVYAGVELIVVPSAFTLATTRDHWEVLLRARAIENQAFVIAANQVGGRPPKGGRSMIVDPWGVVLATAADQPGLVLADLDLAQLADVRRRVPALQHRREAYGDRD